MYNAYPVRTKAKMLVRCTYGGVGETGMRQNVSNCQLILCVHTVLAFLFFNYIFTWHWLRFMHCMFFIDGLHVAR